MKTARRIPSGYIFVGTPADFDDALPFRLSPRVVLRRATAAEILCTKTYLAELSGTYPCGQIFESNFKEELDYFDMDDPPVEVRYWRPIALPPEQWRYNVVSVTRYVGNPFLGDASDLMLLRISSQLSFCPLFLNTATSRGYRQSLDFAADWHHYTNPTESEHKALKYQRQHLEDWRAILKLVAGIKDRFPLVWHSLKLFSDVPIIKGRNELTVLALFTVLESVLTHNPRGEFDSIGHQIGAKIALVSNRMDMKFDYSVFGNSSAETIWRKLYDLRSRIAHGAHVSFSGPLKVLDDTYTVEKFMFSALRSILRFAVKEPALVTDLKAV